MKKSKLRIARATNDLERISAMYESGLGLRKLGSFENHKGFNGAMFGDKESDYHFEFTQENGKKAPVSNSKENLVVFYIPELNEYKRILDQMTQAGFIKVASHNPYWDQFGCTFQDFEGYLVVICNREWNN